MRKSILVLGSVLLFGFTTIEKNRDNSDAKVIVDSAGIEQEINELSTIIETIVQKAELLEQNASSLSLEDSNSEEREAYLCEAHQLRMIALKYNAAVACKTQYLHQ